MRKGRCRKKTLEDWRKAGKLVSGQEFLAHATGVDRAALRRGGYKRSIGLDKK